MEPSHYGLDDFELYRLAREFRKKVYRVVRGLPSEEKYCLGTQMRRAALSVSNNIAEGHGRWHYQENIHFCRIAHGSIDEVLDDINTCLDEAYGEPNDLEALKNEGYVLIRRVNGYIAYLRKSQQGKDDC